MAQNSWDILYPRSASRTNTASLWSTTVAAGTEIDLRQEMSNLLYGASDEIAKGRQGLLRVARIDSTTGEPIKCPCRDEITDEPDLEFYCRTCLGMGFLWDERKIVYYKDDDSVSKKDESYFYMEYDENPARRDWIIEVQLDQDGEPIEPVTRELFYKTLTAEAFRSDLGRIEYWRCRAKLERKWSVRYDVASRQHEPTTRS